MTRAKKPKAPVVSAADFPSLREFFSAYLHEDFGDEYGSAASAARAFLGDASLEEAATTCEEWSKLRKILSGRPMPEVHATLQKLGGAWRPVDMEELETLDAAFMRKAKGSALVRR
ncbi:MAG: hypothetical protein M3P45_09280 [Acidobacteriota bacterium]|nr:hypothetical protein [Acidobacteriota bacterium]